MMFSKTVKPRSKRRGFAVSPAFDEGRTRHPALAQFASARDVASFLADATRSDDEKAPVVDAFVIEHRRSRSKCWAALLIGAFEPLLLFLRKRQGHPFDEDIDQRVLLSFLEALVTPRYQAAHPMASIRFATLNAIRKLKRGEAGLAFELTDEGTSPEEACPVRLTTVLEMREALRILGGLPGANDALLSDSHDKPCEMMAVIGRTVLGDETLSEYVDREYADVDHQRKSAIYHELHERRLELLARVRAHFTKVPWRRPVGALHPGLSRITPSSLPSIAASSLH